MGLLDRLLRRGQTPTAKRGFEAPRAVNRTRYAPFGRIGTETLAAAASTMALARHHVGNNPWATRGADILTVNLVGAGIQPASTHADRATRRRLASAWTRWGRVADADGVTDGNGVVAAAVRAMVVDGEAYIHIIDTQEGPRLRLLPCEMVDASFTADLGGRYVVAGHQFAADGTLEGYHVFRSRPTDAFDAWGERTFIPARDILHLRRPLGAGQVRGISWFAPVLVRLGEIDQLEDALLVGTKVAAMHAGFLVDQTGGVSASPYDGDVQGSVLESGLEPGTLKFVPSGYDIRFSTPQQAAQSIEFAQLELRAVAAGLGVPEHLLTGDMRGVNYSSARTAMVSFRQHVEMIQFQIIIPQVVAPLWERVAAYELLAYGESDFDLAAEFYPPAQPWVDPLKDAEAEALLVEKGFRSRRQVVAAQGFNVEDLDDEIAADREREATMGLSFSTPLTRTAQEPVAP